MKADSAYNKERRKAARLSAALVEIARISGETKIPGAIGSDEFNAMWQINNIAHAGLAEADDILQIKE